MNLNVFENVGYTVLEPYGDLALTVSSCKIHDKVKELLDKKMNHIIVDLGKVNYINSVCISALIGGLISTKNAGGELKLANITDKVKTIIFVTRLDLVFNMYATVEDAIDSFRQTST